MHNTTSARSDGAPQQVMKFMIDLRAYARSLLFLSLTQSVCLFVTDKLQIDSFLFLDGIEPFLAVILYLHVALYKTLFFDFRFRPPSAQNLLPKICNCTKSPISRHVKLYDRQTGYVWAYQGVFGDGRFNGTMYNVATLLPWQRHLAQARRSSRLPACKAS